MVILLKAAIGKSSLVGEFADRHADEAHIHVGYCDDLLTYGSDPYDGRGSGSRCLRSTGMMSSINRTSCDKYQPKSHTGNPVWSAFGPREDQKRRKSMKDVEQQNPRSDYLFRYLPR